MRNLMGLVAVYGCYLGLSLLLQMWHVLNLTSIVLCCVVLGAILYQCISIHATLSDTTENAVDNRPTSRTVPLVVGTSTILVAGMLGSYLSAMGAGPIEPLGSSCNATVHRGRWIRIDGCNEISRGASYRDFGIGSLGTCSALVWGWEAADSHCRFTHRDTQTLQAVLDHRRVIFIGDSIIRHLYHAACRQLGDWQAGSYNTSLEKWSNISRQYGNLAMDFWWAPYTANLTAQVDHLLARHKDTPDLIVIGGGAWDRLHTYHTETERATLRDAVGALSQRLERLKATVPVSWVEPTTMNTWALMSEQKRQNIREDQIAELRLLYRQVGIHNAVSFVLNGTAFTVDRVDESYDGVHYPLAVYDGGAQILVNALDWLLPTKDEDNVGDPNNTVESLGNPWLGLVVVGFCLISIFLFDGFMGASYLAALFLSSAAPHRLLDQSFTALHQRMGLPAVARGRNGSSSSGSIALSTKSVSTLFRTLHESKSFDKRSDSEEEETDRLLTNEDESFEKVSLGIGG
jgi:hypothetical protein